MSGGGRAGALLRDPPKAVVLLACLGALGLRRAQAWSHPQFWAEDSNFYRDALERGLRALWAVNGGYLDLVVRAAAALASGFDPAHAPAVYVGFATVATLYVCGLALSGRCPLPKVAGLAALAVVLVPNTHEVLLNVVNLQWVLAGGFLLVLVSADPLTAGQRAHDLVACILLGLTGPYCILFLPLFAARAAARRTVWSTALAAAVAACAVVQGLLLHFQPAPDIVGPDGGAVAYELLLPTIGQRIGASLLLGAFGPDADRVIGTLAGLVTVAGVAWLAFGPGAHRQARALLGVAGAALLAAGLYRSRHTLYLFFVPSTRARFFYLPQLAVLWLLLAQAASGGAARVCRLLLAWGFLVNLPRFREPAYLDLNWAAYAPAVREGRDVVVPTNPVPWTTHFAARPSRADQ